MSPFAASNRVPCDIVISILILASTITDRLLFCLAQQNEDWRDTGTTATGGCSLQKGKLACNKIGAADVIRSIQETDPDLIDVIDMFRCNIPRLPGNIFANLINTREVTDISVRKNQGCALKFPSLFIRCL